MKLESFWTDTASAFEGRREPLAAEADVVVVGGGFAGLAIPGHFGPPSFPPAIGV